MNTQLILYPQNYKGYSTQSGFLGQEFLIDGNDFTTIMASDVATAISAVPLPAHTVSELLIQQQGIGTGIAPNTWYRFTSNWGGATSIVPTNISNDLIFSAGGATNAIAGVWQRLSSLTVGATYTVTIDAASTVINQNLLIGVWRGNDLSPSGLYSSFAAPLNVSPQVLTFVAQTPDDILVIFPQNFAPYTIYSVTVQSISVISSGFSPTNVPTDLQDGQVICDLYEEQDIPLTLSVDEFKNVAEQVKSYSKDFDLPATKRNNRIFDNMFEITRSIGDGGQIIFNPYIKSRCVLKQEGFTIFEGYLRLIRVKEIDEEISYNVNLYSEVIALADSLKDRTFRDLNFSELSHLYNKDRIKKSWDGVLPLINPLPAGTFAGNPGDTTTDVLAYPFIDWDHQFIVGGQNTSTNNAAVGYPELTRLEQAFRPCIQIKYIIDNIFADTEFKYTSTFFNTGTFGKLFMDFNWGASNSPRQLDDTGEGYCGLDKTVGAAFTTLEYNDNDFEVDINYAAGVFTALQDETEYYIMYSGFIEIIGAGAWSMDIGWAYYDDSTGITTIEDSITITGSGDHLYAGPMLNYLKVMDQNDSIRFVARNNNIGTHTITHKAAGTIFGTVGLMYVVVQSTGIANQALLHNLRGDSGQWDFLKGIMTMFNLVSIVDPDDSTNIIIEPYADIFINNTNSGQTSDLSLASRFNGNIHDWTDKVEAKEMELKPLTDLNKKTILKFAEDSDDYMFNRFKQLENGRLFGSKVFEPGGFDILTGVKDITVEFFAATVCKALMSVYGVFVTPSLYSMDDSGESSAFDNTPRIFFNNGKVDMTSAGITYYMPEENGLSSENQEQFLQFSHLSAIPSISSTSVDYHFESQMLEGNVGVAPVSNLFNTYWLPYLNELYNPNTRIMTLKVNLSPADISGFKFFDTVMIKNKTFRVNKINYKPNSLATVEFILI